MTGPVVRLDFNELAPGARVSNQYFRHGVRITSHDPDHPAMVFDASAPTGGDDDLDAPELGHVLILSEDGDGGDPDDNAGGGVFRFDVDAPAEIRSLTLLDMEAGATIDLYGPDGVKLASRGIRTEDGAHADMTLDVAGVARMFVTLKGSGAIDNVIFAASPLGDGIVEGTDGDDIIDLVYAGDPEGDRIDSGDAILPGEDADDDIVLAEAGDDIVRAGAGDDEIFGGDGDDRLFGNGGDDAIQGQGGNDRIRGGGGDDVLDGGAGDDRVAGGRGDDRLFGGRGDDRLEGGAGVDIINAGADRDLIVGGTAGDIVNGGSGGDDFDTLDLTGTGLRRIDYDPNDPESGIVTFDDDTTIRR